MDVNTAVEVRLGVARVEHALAMAQAMNPSDLKNFSFFEHPVSVERQRRYLKHMVVSETDELMTIEADGKIIGTCGMHEIDQHSRHARLGLMLFSPEDRGKHYGSQAMRSLCRVAFEMWNMHKVYINVIADNAASIGKYVHLGFRMEGVLREHYLLHGKYQDMIVMSMYAKDWMRLKPE